jgi:hypothetical protein
MTVELFVNTMATRFSHKTPKIWPLIEAWPIFRWGFHLLLPSSGSYPLAKGRQWLDVGGLRNEILGGWQLGTIVTAQTGSPFTIIDRNDVGNNGEPGYRFPNYSGVSPNLPSGQQNPAH